MESDKINAALSRIEEEIESEMLALWGEDYVAGKGEHFLHHLWRRVRWFREAIEAE